MSRTKVLVLASGEPLPDKGGSGFKRLVEATKLESGVLNAEITGVASNHPAGGVFTKAQELGVPFLYLPPPWSADQFQNAVEWSKAEFVLCSGMLKFVRGLDPRTTINIHPGNLPRFGGKRMYGHHVHEATMEAYGRRDIDHTAICMHFVTEEGYDRGPVFFRLLIRIRQDDTPDTLQKRVNRLEHLWQPIITELVLRGEIRWDGIDPESLVVPQGYTIDRYHLEPSDYT